MGNIERFHNKTTDGNETAFKRGNSVPPNAVNLAWTQVPTISPETNMVVVDTSTVTPENIEIPQSGIYYANLLGKLEDDQGNQLLTEQYPAIGDEFSIEGDISNIDISSEYIFPYVHVSRFFHVDKAGLSPGTLLSDYSTSAIKVIDSSGNLYADANGNPKFRIKIISVYQPWPGISNSSLANPSESIAAYRVHAFIDSNTIDNLFLTYDKIEITEDGALVNQVIGYQEILNPQPYFEYRPEEAEVADFANREQDWYSSKSTALKDQLLGLPATDTDGYEIVVPKKAIPDPRLFQLFRWRVVCSFSENFSVGTEVDHPINCGVIVTNNTPTSSIAQIFNTISDNPINIASAVFANPLNITQSSLSKSTDAYWYVNIDTITNDELDQFDLLVWSPDSPTFDFTQYLGKIQYFTNILGHVLLIDTDSYLIPEGLGITTTAGTLPQTGESVTTPVASNNPTPTDTDSPADPSTWLPQVFLGILQNVTNFNPPPPPGSGWSATLPPSDTHYLEYLATDGQIYWKSTFIVNGSPQVVGFTASALVTALTNTIDDSVYVGITPADWVPPVFAGVVSDLPNAAPPGGTNWSSTPVGGNVLSYKATDGTTYYCQMPVGSAYALVNPAITISGDIETLVNDIQSWFPEAYPNISANGGAIGTNVNPAVATSPPTGEYTGLAGALYNLPPANLNLPSTSYAVTPTNLSYYLPITERNPVSDTDNGATYNTASNIFDASILNGWTIDTSEPISYFQTCYGVSGGKVQYLLDLPQGSNTLVSGQLANLTTAKITNPITFTTTDYIDTKATTSASTIVSVGGLTSGFTVGQVGTINITLPTLPDNAVLSQIAITTSTPYSNAPNGLGVIISSPTNTIGIGSQVSSPNVVGTLNQTYLVSNGSSLDLTQPFNMTYTDANAILGQITITATFSYYTTIASANTTNATSPSSPIPFLSPVPLMVESGYLLISTLGIPQSICAGIAGSSQLLYNIALYATANRALATFSDQSYSASFNFASPWQNSWVINATDYPTVLNDLEKNQYDFFYLPEDAATPVNVWQRKLSDSSCEDLINSSVDPSLLEAVAGANRTYTLEVSNSLVETSTNIFPSTIPYAWTRAYTSTLMVPPDLETYIVRETEIQGDYASGTYINRSYPEKPYLCQSRAYMDSDNVGTLNVNWTASGTATLTYNTEFYTPPSTEIETVPVTTSAEVILNAADHGLPGNLYVETHLPYIGVTVPGAIQTYQDDNYYSPGTSQCWPFYGLTGSYQIGSTGEVVEFIQDALNYFHNQGYWQLPAGYLTVNGVYDGVTAFAVLAFQQHFFAIYQDGIVDAETFSIIGTQILRSGRTDTATDYHRFYNWPWNRIQYRNISDGDPGSMWQKRSISNGSPGYIWELISITLDQTYSVHGITITPWVEGITDTIRIDGVNALISPSITAFGGYNPASMMLPRLGLRGGDNQPVYIPFNPVQANQVFVNIGQDGPAYPGMDTRVFGVRDISVNATVTTTSLVSETIVIPGYYTTNTVSVVIPISSSGTAAVSFARDYTANISPQFVGNGTISNIVWDSIQIDNPELNANITANGLLSIGVAGAAGNIVVSGDMTFGPILPTNAMAIAYPGIFQTPAYELEAPVQWMSPNGIVSPIPEVGMISKADGVKLLCDGSGNPVGFPLLPTNASLEQRHYVNISLSSYGTDSAIQLGFYDISQQAFIVDANGLPQITYADYNNRGANNVFIGVLSTFEIDTQTSLPNSDDSPPIPNAMVMPAYGVQTLSGSKIGLTPLPADLNRDDLWPISVRTGSFARPLVIPPTSTSALTGYLSKYQGTSVTAYYGIPEAEDGAWSSLYGKPYIDIGKESPIIQDLSTIQVRQPPILMKRQPTIYDTLADPVRPIFTVYTKGIGVTEFTALDWSNIEDYEVSTGTIHLSVPLDSSDSSLVAVDYTSTQDVYLFKEFDGTVINLNPYSTQNDTFANNPIYVYILPEYVRDSNGNIISDSQQTRTLRYSLDTTIFDPLDPHYDPTAIQLGIIYITTNFDMSDIILLDSRRRGGGAQDGISDSALTSTLKDALNYWEVSYGTGMSYQDGCFVIIRLPAELKNSFTEAEITEIIQRNISAGVQFNIEDTEGNDW